MSIHADKGINRTNKVIMVIHMVITIGYSYTTTSVSAETIEESTRYSDSPILTLKLESRGGWNFAPAMEISLWSDGSVHYVSTNDLLRWVENQPFILSNWKPDLMYKNLSNKMLDNIMEKIFSICAGVPVRKDYISPSGAVISMTISYGDQKHTLRTSDFSFIRGENMVEFDGLDGYNEFVNTWMKLYGIIYDVISEKKEAYESAEDSL